MKLKLLLFAFAALGSLFGAADAFAQTYAITNAEIVTVSGPTVQRGTIVIRNGLIESVGAAVKVPADAKVFDGNGLTVYPGFIDSLTSLGLPSAPSRPSSTEQSSADGSNSNYPEGVRPELTAASELKAGEDQFESVRSAGFTTALTTGRTGIFNGQSALIDLAGESVSAMMIRSPVAQHFSFTTAGRGNYPASLLGTFSAFRQMMLDSKRQFRLENAYRAKPLGMKRPDADASLTALYPLVNGEIPIVFNANRDFEILRALDLAKEFNLKAIIAGGQEAWKVADRLKAENVPVLLSVNFPKRTTAASPEADPESMDMLRFRAETPKGPAILAKKGVRFAFQSGGTKSLNEFFTNSGKAVEAGLSKAEAIRAMTLGAAEIFGVSDRLGSLDAGKIANITVVRGDNFSKDRVVKYVFVDGKLFEPKEKPAAKPGTSTTGSAIASVGGNYSIVIQIPGQSMSGTLVLIQQGSSLTGTIQSELGTAPIRNGKVTADGFTFDATVDVSGSSTEISVSGKVAGNEVNGMIDSPQGAVAFSGTKNP